MAFGSPTNREQFYERRASSELDRFPQKDPATVRVVLNLLSTYDVAEKMLSRRLQPHGLSPSTFNVLMILRQYADGCAMSVMSDLLVVSRANITGLVDSLEERGLVGRISCPSDRRSKFARITGDGLRLLEEILPEHYAYIRQLLADLSADEKAQLTELLTKMRRSVLRHAPEGVE